MRRRVLIMGTVLVVFAAGMSWWAVARAAAPINCTWPTSPDNFDSVISRQELTVSLFNQLLCAVNSLEVQVSALLSAPAVPEACQAGTWQPAERKAVTLTYSETFVGSEPVYPTVVSQSSPSFLVIDGVEPPSGSMVTVWVFNHDAQLSQTGTVCARVIQ